MESSVSPAASVPKWVPDFRGQIKAPNSPTDDPVFVQDQAVAADGLRSGLPTPTPAPISIGDHTTITALSEEAQTLHPPAVNDDTSPRKHRRKRKSRRKAKRDDRRRCRTTMTISKKDYNAGMTAWGVARISGRPLDTLVTLRPVGIDDMTMPERRDWFMRRIKSLGQWFADNDNRPEFTALWSREARRIGTGRKATALGEHIHILVHAGEHRADLERMLRKSLRGRNEVDVRPATQEVMRLNCGWLGDAATYILKAVNQQVWRAHRTTPHRPSGPIYGARCGWTNNIDTAA